MTFCGRQTKATRTVWANLGLSEKSQRLPLLLADELQPGYEVSKQKPFQGLDSFAATCADGIAGHLCTV